MVGHDEAGNAYYRTPRQIDPALGFERRWVIYNGVSRGLEDPARLERLASPHGRRRADRGRLQPHPWELPHMPNPTGTPAAIRPDGSTLRPGPRQPTGGDYEAWSPGP